MIFKIIKYQFRLILPTVYEQKNNFEHNIIKITVFDELKILFCLTNTYIM